MQAPHRLARSLVALSMALTLPLLVACQSEESQSSSAPAPVKTAGMKHSDTQAESQHLASSAEGSIAAKLDTLTVYKSPTCGCCKDWITHVEERGFQTQTVHPADLPGLKQQYGIPVNARSCHTAVSANGYVFEGHVPARYIHEFLANPPADAIGLTVPAMPVGSPGMEVDDKFMPYQVWILKKDGSGEVLASIDNPDMQYQ